MAQLIVSGTYASLFPQRDPGFVIWVECDTNIRFRICKEYLFEKELCNKTNNCNLGQWDAQCHHAAEECIRNIRSHKQKFAARYDRVQGLPPCFSITYDPPRTNSAKGPSRRAWITCTKWSDDHMAS